jgi:phospholipid/cholesterol/gamma-HCH transport system permease protein
MPDASEEVASLVEAQLEGDQMSVVLKGRWSTSVRRPTWKAIRGERWPAVVRFDAGALQGWDSSLLLFVSEAEAWCAEAGARCDKEGLDPRLRAMLAEIAATRAKANPSASRPGVLASIGIAGLDLVERTKGIFGFVGSCVLGAVSAARHPKRFRWRDCVAEMQQCGAMALPIVGVISLLVGLIMAYQAAVQLRQFGADIYVADLVGLSVVREMGPMMAAVVLAGRTGAAFAATLGNMKMNEEIDALQTLGVSPVEFLVLPRMLALGVMMPLLAMYANLLGILGGMYVSMALLGIPPSAYWIETQLTLDLSDISTGLIKSATFGLLIGIAGCLRGLEADRSAAGVGRAATSAVVTGILFIILADALYAVIFQILGW